MGLGYRWIHTMQGIIDIDDVVVEIGASREGCSTEYLATFCKQFRLEFHSVDFSSEAIEKIEKIDGVIVHRRMGEDWLQTINWVDKRIGFAYLDNFDWIYSISANSVVRARVKDYVQQGLVLNNFNSALSHFNQAVEIVRLASDKCMVVIDDTWMREDTIFLGKGMLAAPYLMSKGFQLVNKPKVGDEVSDSFVVLARELK